MESENRDAEWEIVNSQGASGVTVRMEVPGGWLYRFTHNGASVMVFVPVAGWVYGDRR